MIDTAHRPWVHTGSRVEPKELEYNFKEDVILAELKQYIDSTYGQHYSNSKLQTIDVWEALGIEKESCQSNVIKYAMRYGKKGGANKADLLKILHYTILWWYYTQINNE